jgi:hypothetical protein
VVVEVVGMVVDAADEVEEAAVSPELQAPPTTRTTTGQTLFIAVKLAGRDRGSG